jgi:hypothetical protein
MGHQVLTATRMNMAVFWDVVPCNLVRRFRGTYYPAVIVLITEAISTSETSITIYDTT